MAKNYNIGEVVKIVAEGKDFEAIMDIGRRYPLLMNKVTKLVTLAGETASDFFSYMPEYLTANKVNKMIKDAVIDGDAEEAEDTEEAEEKPAKKEKATKKEKKAKKVEDDEEEADDAEDEDNPYSGKTAPELYKECKKRGIKVAAKKDAKYYEKALLKADAADVETEEAEEDWEEEKPAKPAKKEKAAKKEKKAKKEEEEVEEDEDWDI